jgi:acetyltransferase-like isoleucine patch superfamily enzyme
MNFLKKRFRSNGSEDRVVVIQKQSVAVGRFTYGIEDIKIKQWGEGAKLRIGSFCSLGSEITFFLGGNHRSDWISTYPFGHIFQEQLSGKPNMGHPSSNGDITLGHDVWVGHGVTFMSGVEIGSGAVIAANSHVTRSVGPYEVFGGNPAKKIKDRFDPETVDLLLELQWWTLPVEQINTLIPSLTSCPSKEDLKKYRSNV